MSQQIDTLLRQTYPVHEILIQDDGSTDGTMSILKAYAVKHPCISVCTNEGARGINSNFFSAMRKARGEYIALCDQDDLWAPDKIAKQMETIGNSLLCTCRGMPFSSDGSPVTYDPRHPNCHLVRLLYSSIAGHTMLFHRRLIELLPDVNDDYNTYYDVVLALTAACNQQLAIVNEFLVSERRHSEAATYVKPDMRRRPSVGNGLYILRWSLCHYARVRPYMYKYFQHRLRLLENIKAAGPLYEDAVRIVGLEGKGGLLNLLRLCRLHVKYRHHLFYVEGHGLVNLLRAALYCVMQVYNYQYLLPERQGHHSTQEPGP